MHYRTATEDCYSYHEGESYEARSSYKGYARIMYLGSFGAIVSPMQGEFQRQEMLDILKHIRGVGCTHAFAEREEGHGLPWGHRMSKHSPAGANWFVIDLVELFPDPLQ